VTRCSQSAQQSNTAVDRAYAGRVSTRRLIITALLCGMAILIAFAVQASQWS
jgi:hypothetical protein